jgi:tetrahydromethanopterin S-methyltransferase subunit A
MSKNYYSWGGEFVSLSPTSNTAVVILNFEYIPKEKIAIYGSLKTENIGIEKIVANIISNPNIRYLLICGKEIRGHKSGESLKALHEFGIDEDNRIINAPGAIPYIENLNKESIKRFQDQIELLDFINITDEDKLNKIIKKHISKDTKSFGKPFIAIRFKKIINMKLDDKRALHSKIRINYLGKIEKRLKR